MKDKQRIIYVYKYTGNDFDESAYHRNGEEKKEILEEIKKPYQIKLVNAIIVLIVTAFILGKETDFRFCWRIN